MLPSDSILGVGTTGREHLVESGNAVTLLEFHDILTNLMDDARDIVALVGVVEILQPF